MDKVQKMIHYAVMKHSKQRRKGEKGKPWLKIPYIAHPMEVMKLCSFMEIADEDVLAAAVGHDLIEDTDSTYEEIEMLFGKRVADIILECTREGGDDVTKKQKFKFLQSFRNKSLDSVVIKLADRSCNVCDYFLQGKKDYSAKYGLQAFPLIDAWDKRHDSENVVGNIEKVNWFVSKMKTQILMGKNYYGMSEKNGLLKCRRI
jgi:guanosine-3',5'-bis(diphosphate) 3'-pyrophosphohydrolase